MGRDLGIIGTAGRDKSAFLNPLLWKWAVRDCKTRVTKDDNTFTGGAAWIDHLPVRLFRKGYVKSLTLYFPAPFVNGRFVGPPGSAASAANFYHDRFKIDAGVPSLWELEDAIAMGAKVIEQPAAKGYAAMFARNALVARAVKEVVAYTFGVGEEPDDGGTLNTWKMVKGKRTHVTLPLLRAPKYA